MAEKEKEKKKKKKDKAEETEQVAPKVEVLPPVAALVPTTKLTVGGFEYDLKKEPPPDSKVVADAKTYVLEGLAFGGMVTDLRATSDLLFVAACGVAGARHNPDLPAKVSAIRFGLLEALSDTDTAMFSLATTSKGILGSLKDGFGFLYRDPPREDATLTYLTNCAQQARSMATAVGKLATAYGGVATKAQAALETTYTEQGLENNAVLAAKEQQRKLKEQEAKAKANSKNLAEAQKKMQALIDEAKAAQNKAEDRAFALAIVSNITSAVSSGVQAFAAYKMAPATAAMGVASGLSSGLAGNAVTGPVGQPANRGPTSGITPPPGVGTPPPGVGTPPPGVGTPPPGVGTPPPGVGTPPPGVGTPPPGVGTPPPGVGTPPPGVGTPPPGVGTPPPGVGTPPPGGGTPPPGVGTPPPGVGTPPPGVGTPPPGGGTPPPGVGTPPPGGGTPPPGVGTPPPGVGATPGTGIDAHTSAALSLAASAANATVAAGNASAAATQDDIAARYAEERKRYFAILMDLQKEEREALAAIAEYAEQMKNLGAAEKTAETAVKCLQQAVVALSKITTVLENCKHNWELMALACERLVDSNLVLKIDANKTDKVQERIKTYMEDEFKEQLLGLAARWLALHLVAKDLRAQIAEVRELHRSSINKAPTIEEARELAPKLGEKLKLDIDGEIKRLEVVMQAVKTAASAPVAGSGAPPPAAPPANAPVAT